ncbi:hypothetical protein CLV93_109103 [Prolixibacter denitrificans]|uniref:Uncharacterized protein n=1 Tax=Prolixibacter denitrificans TaxID=1541063 RepID=A0A2P8C949_9BACT|nr:hypothetical protein CLV93_109103 [Prolixibacter denitrificans]
MENLFDIPAGGVNRTKVLIKYNQLTNSTLIYTKMIYGYITCDYL